MTRGDLRLRRWYIKFNKAYFNGELPEDTIVFWQPTHDASAVTCPVFEVADGKFQITIGPEVMGFGCYWKMLLLHEMTHVKLWRTHPKHQHGKQFQAEMLRLVQAGAFRRLW